MVIGSATSRWTNSTKIQNVYQSNRGYTYTFPSFKYLITWNFETIIDDRHPKATKISKMVLWALRTSTKVSTELSIGLFDKLIAPIILYGSSTYIIPSSHNLIYLDYLPEFRNTRTTDRQTLHDTCGYDITFTSARRAGMASSDGTRRILISLINIQDKESVLSNTGKYDLQIMYIKCNPLLINSTTIFVSSLLMSANMNITLQYWAN